MDWFSSAWRKPKEQIPTEYPLRAKQPTVIPREIKTLKEDEIRLQGNSQTSRKLNVREHVDLKEKKTIACLMQNSGTQEQHQSTFNIHRNHQGRKYK